MVAKGVASCLATAEFVLAQPVERAQTPRCDVTPEAALPLRVGEAGSEVVSRQHSEAVQKDGRYSLVCTPTGEPNASPTSYADSKRIALSDAPGKREAREILSSSSPFQSAEDGRERAILSNVQPERQLDQAVSEATQRTVASEPTFPEGHWESGLELHDEDSPSPTGRSEADAGTQLEGPAQGFTEEGCSLDTPDSQGVELLSPAGCEPASSSSGSSKGGSPTCSEEEYMCL